MSNVSVSFIKRYHRSSNRRKGHQRTGSEKVSRVKLASSQRPRSIRRADTTRTLYSVRRVGVIGQPDVTLEQYDAKSQSILEDTSAQDLTNDKIIHTYSSTSAQSIPISEKRNLSSNQKERIDSHPKTVISIINKNLPLTATLSSSSSIKPFDSINRFQTAPSSLKQESILSLKEIGSIDKRDERKWKGIFHNGFFQISDFARRTSIGECERENRSQRRRRRRKEHAGQPWYCKCCCVGLILLLVLLLCGLAALFAALFGSKGNTTTTTTTTTTTATTTTSTTTTTTTITTTTTSTTTTTTSTTSVTTTTTTTPMPPCTPTNIGSASTLLSLSSIATPGYSCYCYQWTAPSTGSVTLSFEIRNDPSYTYLDDVSVYDGATQMLINGGFDTGSLTPWVKSYPNGTCSGIAGQVCSTTAHSGSYEYCDGCYGRADVVSQSFMVTAGDLYIVSFWLGTGGTGSVISAVVTLQ